MMEECVLTLLFLLRHLAQALLTRVGSARLEGDLTVLISDWEEQRWSPLLSAKTFESKSMALLVIRC